MAMENYLIRLNRPQNITVADMCNYIKEAVDCWGRGLRPPGSYDAFDEGDPLWGVNALTVKKLPKARANK